MKWLTKGQKQTKVRTPKAERQEYDGKEFLALCARCERGEIRITQFGVGSTPAMWWVDYTVNQPALF